MLNFVIGGFVALFFLGLPLAIIALFVASFLEKRPIVSETRVRAEPIPDRAADDRRDKRRRVIYGGHSTIAGKLSDREKSMHLHGTKV
jgi:hypothetical protein